MHEPLRCFLSPPHSGCRVPTERSLHCVWFRLCSRIWLFLFVVLRCAHESSFPPVAECIFLRRTHITGAPRTVIYMISILPELQTVVRIVFVNNLLTKQLRRFCCPRSVLRGIPRVTQDRTHFTQIKKRTARAVRFLFQHSRTDRRLSPRYRFRSYDH